jgi:hypothetical protein
MDENQPNLFGDDAQKPAEKPPESVKAKCGGCGGIRTMYHYMIGGYLSRWVCNKCGRLYKAKDIAT